MNQPELLAFCLHRAWEFRANIIISSEKTEPGIKFMARARCLRKTCCQLPRVIWLFGISLLPGGFSESQTSISFSPGCRYQSRLKATEGCGCSGLCPSVRPLAMGIPYNSDRTFYRSREQQKEFTAAATLYMEFTLLGQKKWERNGVFLTLNWTRAQISNFELQENISDQFTALDILLAWPKVTKVAWGSILVKEHYAFFLHLFFHCLLQCFLSVCSKCLWEFLFGILNFVSS